MVKTVCIKCDKACFRVTRFCPYCGTRNVISPVSPRDNPTSMLIIRANPWRSYLVLQKLIWTSWVWWAIIGLYWVVWAPHESNIKLFGAFTLIGIFFVPAMLGLGSLSLELSKTAKFTESREDDCP